MNYLINKLPRAIKEDLFNQHAMFNNPEATERSFYLKSVPVKYIDLSKIPDDVLYDMSDSECNEYYDAMEKDPALRLAIISESKLKDGLHRITALKRKGVTSMMALDFSDLINVNDSGFICDVSMSNEKPMIFKQSSLSIEKTM